MAKILVAGLINIETTLRIEDFPVLYQPVRFPFWGVNTTVSGVGYNVARALTVLGDEARFLALIGRDGLGQLALQSLEADAIPRQHVLPALTQTPQSVILYDGSGQRAINVDLKDIQEQSYPWAEFESALAGCDLAALCNINFARPFLEATTARGIPIATDVHTIADLDDAYNRDFMAAADILFMSHEALPVAPEEWARRILKHFGPKIVVIGLGREGALLVERRPEALVRLPAVFTRPVVNSIGAGDALFSAFIHFYAYERNAYDALRKAVVFASYKIGETGAAAGLLTEAELLAWCKKVRQP
ncbi:MAG: carbohydrate kinase family protein [Anaerolineae bacterium]|nr:carbohydrate kinase family protein [Anaerolineae bacterium]